MTLSLAIAGCGVMGRRHVLGLKKLQDVDRLRLIWSVFYGDPIPASAAAMAHVAEEHLSRPPASMPRCHRSVALWAWMRWTSPPAPMCARV